jgi:hypothetical protein
MVSSILQIVPRQPPPEEALFQVAQRLLEAFGDHGVESRIVAASPDRSRFEQALAAAPADQVVLLHYVGYGYARRGAPNWLARSLDDWLESASGRRLAVHFHEVAASGPPWRSSFWLAPMQRRVAARLRRAAIASITSVERFAFALERLEPSRPPRLLPIFSTIGEPREVQPWLEREPVLVLFGSPNARARIWAESPRELGRVARALGIRRVIEIGRDATAPFDHDGIPIERTGELASGEISRLLSSAMVAYLDYPVEYLSKSSAFAAVCAHGVLPVCRLRREHEGAADGEGWRWLSVDDLEHAETRALAEIAAAARKWYLGHSIAMHADHWLESLRP